MRSGVHLDMSASRTSPRTACKQPAQASRRATSRTLRRVRWKALRPASVARCKGMTTAPGADLYGRARGEVKALAVAVPGRNGGAHREQGRRPACALLYGHEGGQGKKARVRARFFVLGHPGKPCRQSRRVPLLAMQGGQCRRTRAKGGVLDQLAGVRRCGLHDAGMGSGSATSRRTSRGTSSKHRAGVLSNRVRGVLSLMLSRNIVAESHPIECGECIKKDTPIFFSKTPYFFSSK